MEIERSRRSVPRYLLLSVAVLALGSALSAAPSLTQSRSPDAPSPAWLDVSRCNTYCQLYYLDHGDMRGYNTCYACNCLVDAAENASEFASAMAQCQRAARASW